MVTCTFGHVHLWSRAPFHGRLQEACGCLTDAVCMLAAPRSCAEKHSVLFRATHQNSETRFVDQLSILFEECVLRFVVSGAEGSGFCFESLRASAQSCAEARTVVFRSALGCGAGRVHHVKGF